MTLTIPAAVDYRIGGSWEGLPYLDAPATITDTFGNYPDWRKGFDHDGDPSTPPKDFGPHKGIDMGNARHNRLGAVDDGTVFWVQYGHEVMGNYIIIIHPTTGPGLQETEATYYLHMQSIEVQTGQKVRRGNYIGREGSTGAVTGPHLHFAVRVNDAYVNPMDYVVPPSTTPPVPAPPPAFTPEPHPSGQTLTLFSGGGEADLMAAMTDYNLTSVAVTDSGGNFVMYVNGAPPFVHQAFMALFPDGIPPNTPMMVTK